MLRRNLIAYLGEAMSDTPVVLIHGARQTGKSTLARAYASSVGGGSYVTLDDATSLAGATDDPDGFLSGYDGPLVLDEVQRAPDLFRAIKLRVDRDRQPGRYLLTGSADIMLLPGLSESLAGRMEILTLWPFSGAELGGSARSMVDLIFSDAPLPAPKAPEERPALLDRIVAGGFPEAALRASEKRRHAWFGAYITTILQRDVREVSNVDQLESLPRLLKLLASRTMSLMNASALSRSFGMPYTTLKRYLALLEMTFLFRQLPPWSANLGKRLVKSPKLMLCDTGLAAHLLGATSGKTISDHEVGGLVENYVAMELVKHIGWSETPASLYHFREQTGKEVDLLLENAAGKIAGIEVKAAARVKGNDFKYLRFLKEQLGDRFLRGVIFYTGTETVTFGGNMTALPLSVLHE